MGQIIETEATTHTVESNGLCAIFKQRMICLAAEPHATFIRLSVTDNGQEVAYETAVLGRLRRGYRVFWMRSLVSRSHIFDPTISVSTLRGTQLTGALTPARQLGTRIELCYVFVKISFKLTRNDWAAPRQQQRQVGELRRRLEFLEATLASSMGLLPLSKNPSLEEVRTTQPIRRTCENRRSSEMTTSLRLAPCEVSEAGNEGEDKRRARFSDAAASHPADSEPETDVDGDVDGDSFREDASFSRDETFTSNPDTGAACAESDPGDSFKSEGGSFPNMAMSDPELDSCGEDEDESWSRDATFTSTTPDVGGQSCV